MSDKYTIMKEKKSKSTKREGGYAYGSRKKSSFLNNIDDKNDECFMQINLKVK